MSQQTPIGDGPRDDELLSDYVERKKLRSFWSTNTADQYHWADDCDCDDDWDNECYEDISYLPHLGTTEADRRRWAEIDAKIQKEAEERRQQLAEQEAKMEDLEKMQQAKEWVREHVARYEQQKQKIEQEQQAKQLLESMAQMQKNQEEQAAREAEEIKAKVEDMTSPFTNVDNHAMLLEIFSLVQELHPGEDGTVLFRDMLNQIRMYHEEGLTAAQIKTIFQVECNERRRRQEMEALSEREAELEAEHAKLRLKVQELTAPPPKPNSEPDPLRKFT